jgi:hypothetical protein
MAVMGVAHMRVGMLQLPVAVLMGMPEGVIAGLTQQLFRGVVVFVMGIGTAGIVAVAMGMAQGIVAMPVAVLLQQQQHHPSAHQPHRQQQGR